MFCKRRGNTAGDALMVRTFTHPWKESAAMWQRCFAWIVMHVNDIQSAKADPKIRSTLSGRVIDAKLEQPLNVSYGMQRNPSGRSTDCRCLQFKKASPVVL
mmetsp:Transcript_26572/g.30611  ORF Transcript_26572/g.30611 Transcript_26572/m.30611 type:complete len:101 (+) Transcript_26572:251-553(+)